MTFVIWAQTIVLAITAVLIWWYTLETARLRKETVRQNKVSLRPVVLPEFSAGDPAGAFQIRNVGNGCAFNIVVTPVGTANFEGFGTIESRFEPIEYLSSGQAATVEPRFYVDGKRTKRSVFEDWFHPRYPGAEDVTIEIRFADVEGGQYRLRVVVQAEEDRANLPRKVRLGAIEDVAERRRV